MNRGKIAFNHSSAEWNEWLSHFPTPTELELGAAMKLQRSISIHLDSMPEPAILTKQERRWIATDLSNFCEKLVKDNSNINKIALAGWGGSGLSLAGLILVPGAQIPFAVATFGLGGYSAYKAYISWQKQREIDRLTANIGTVIWSLKNSS